MTIDEFFSDKEQSQKLFEAIQHEVDAIGSASIRITKSQIAFRRRRNFAWRDESPRWKEIVEPVTGRFMHHLELNSITDIDEQVSVWLRKAWEAAV